MESYYDPFDLRWPLLRLGYGEEWTIGDACEHTLILGATGAGKTSGSGKSIAMSFLKAGFGGLVLTAKPDETENWLNYCDQAGRRESVIRFSPDGPYRFNFLDYEQRREGGGETENIISMFFSVLEVVERQSGGREPDEYWQRTSKQILRNAVELLMLAEERLSCRAIKRVIQTAPTELDDLRDEDWKADSFCWACAQGARDKVANDPSKQGDLEIALEYWMEEYIRIPEKTRETIVSIILSMMDVFMRGSLRKLFSEETNVLPELCERGAIILLDLPVKTHKEIGLYGQLIFKFLWQQAMERRSFSDNDRPVFLWADESQFFANSHDAMFLTTARSARACTVYLTQNLPNYYAMMGGGDRAKDLTQSFLGNFQTKIWHQNTCSVTNNWASETVAKTWQDLESQSYNSGGKDGKGGGFTFGQSSQMEFDLPPREFTTLAKGGPRYDLKVEGIVSIGGRVFQANGKPYMKVAFNQQAM